MGDHEIFRKTLGQAFRQGGERDRRGVGRHHASSFTHSFDFRVERLLDVEALDHRLDDPVAIGEETEMIFDVACGHEFGGGLAHEGRRIGLEQFRHRAFGDGAAVWIILGDDVEEQDRDAGVGDMGGDARAHHAGADDGYFFDVAHHTASRTVAMPWPPPMHWVASAYLPFSRRSSEAALPRMRAPVAPSGWPSAMAPPSMLTVSSDSFRSLTQAIDCEAKASFNSTTSSWPASMPARAKALREAPTGPMPMISGAQPETAIDLIAARTSRSWRLA